MIEIEGVVLPIWGISRNAKEGRVMSTDSLSLNDSDIRVAHAMGIDPKAVAMVKYKHGKRGLAGVSLHGGSGLPRSPFPPAKSIPGDTGINPGDMDDELVKTVLEPENSDDEDVKDPAGIVGPPMRVLFPDGSSNESRRKRKEK
jgi:hypothetical protein